MKKRLKIDADRNLLHNQISDYSYCSDLSEIKDVPPCKPKFSTESANKVRGNNYKL